MDRVRSAYPRVTAFIESLPVGLDSYPTCVQKGSIPRMWLAEGPSLENVEELPTPVRRLIEQPPLASSWVPEVHANALYLAMCEGLFASDEDFLAFCFRTNVKFFQTPLYRALTVIPSPASFLHAARIGWKLLRRGTFIAMTRTAPNAIRIRLSWPPLVTPEVLARTFVTSFHTAIEASSSAENVRVSMSNYARDSAVYDMSWE